MNKLWLVIAIIACVGCNRVEKSQPSPVSHLVAVSSTSGPCVSGVKDFNCDWSLPVPAQCQGFVNRNMHDMWHECADEQQIDWQMIKDRDREITRLKAELERSKNHQIDWQIDCPASVGHTCPQGHTCDCITGKTDHQ